MAKRRRGRGRGGARGRGKKNDPEPVQQQDLQECGEPSVALPDHDDPMDVDVESLDISKPELPAPIPKSVQGQFENAEPVQKKSDIILKQQVTADQNTDVVDSCGNISRKPSGSSIGQTNIPILNLEKTSLPILPQVILPGNRIPVTDSTKKQRIRIPVVPLLSQVPVPVDHSNVVKEKSHNFKKPLDPFYLCRNYSASASNNKKSVSLIKQVKKTKKELKSLGIKKKVKKSLGSFLGDKVKYNMEEMLRDVQLGMKPGWTQEQFCSLGSIVKHPPIARKIITSFHPTQFSGFRLHHHSTVHVSGSSKEKRDEKLFKVPESPAKKSKTVRKK